MARLLAQRSRRLTNARLLPCAALALLACLPAGQAKASVAGEFESLANSREGKLATTTIERQYVAGSWRDNLAGGLAKYPGQLTAFQKELIRLSLKIASPRYRELRDALVRQRVGAKLLPELRALLGDILRSPALRLLLRKGEWLKQHPAALQDDLAVYAALAGDASSSPLDRKLGAILSRPEASRFIQRLSPLRVVALLTPLQVDGTPPTGPTASSSSVGGFCKAAKAYVVGKAVSAYMWYENTFPPMLEWATAKAVHIFKRRPPDRDDVAQLAADLVTHHPSQALTVVGDNVFSWALGAAVVDGVMSTAEGIHQGIVKLQGADTPTKPAERRQLFARGGARAGASKVEGGACLPSKGADSGAPAGGAGEGPLHWTGKIQFDNSWTEALVHDNGEPPGTSVGTSTATWNVDAYSPEAGTERAPGEYSYYYLPYIGSWNYSLRDDEFCGSSPTVETIEGSGSGPPPPTHGFPWWEEVLIEPPWLLHGWWLRLSSTPLGERHLHVESCPPGYDLVQMSVPFYPQSGGDRGTPGGCNMDLIPLQWKPFSAPGRIVGQWTSSLPYCKQAVLSWDLTVSCPNGAPPVEEGPTLACVAPVR